MFYVDTEFNTLLSITPFNIICLFCYYTVITVIVFDVWLDLNVLNDLPLQLVPHQYSKPACRSLGWRHAV